MSKPSKRCFDLSTIDGVRIFGFDVAEAAKHLSALPIENAAHFKTASDRLTDLVLELGGDRSEKDSALLAKVADFNLREPQFLGYLEGNDLLQSVLIDLSEGSFLNSKDFRPPFVKKNLNNIALANIRNAELITQITKIADDLLKRAKDGLLAEPIPTKDAFERMRLEIIFSLKKERRGNTGEKKIFDYREEAALEAFCLWWNRKQITDRHAEKEPALKACVREILESGKYKRVAPGSASAENQIEIPDPENLDAACRVIVEITKEYISEYENAACRDQG